MTIKDQLKSFISNSIKRIYGVSIDIIPIIYPDLKKYGDYATTVAMTLAKNLKKNPRELASGLADDLNKRPEFLNVEIAGAGYINFFLSDEFLTQEIRSIIEKEKYGKSDILKGEKILLEFVSANPTGPLHIGHGRWAAIGDSMLNILKYCGAEVSSEFYINDAGNQINLLYQSINAVRDGLPVPENGYHGGYINEIAKMEGDPAVNLLKIQKETLAGFRVNFDRFFSEKSLHESGSIKETIEFIRKSGHGYDKDGAFWFRTTDFGDDKDRVLIKSDGEYTYFAVDIAYHRNKINRNFTSLINVLGADHHGYVKRMEAAVKVCSEEVNKKIDFKIIIGQLVNLFRNGEPVRMSKRTGEMITLEEVVEEIGVDAARYYLVMRKTDTPLDFDIEAAKQKSEENPVFYVQYAHARISGIIRNIAEIYDNDILESFPEKIIDSMEARDLAVELIKFPELVADSAISDEPHRIPLYLENLAGVFHRFYNQHRVITDNIETTRKRIQFVYAAKRIINIGLKLIGVSSPDRM